MMTLLHDDGKIYQDEKFMGKVEAEKDGFRWTNSIGMTGVRPEFHEAMLELGFMYQRPEKRKKK